MTISAVTPLTASLSACPYCRSDQTSMMWPQQPLRETSLRWCRDCALAFTVPALSEEALAMHYQNEYYGPQDRRFWPLLESIVRWYRQRRARYLDRVSPHAVGSALRLTKRALDIGCGRGWTLDYLRQLGWDVAGVELNAAAAAHARDVLQLDVQTTGFDPRNYADHSYDLVILWHVLEHFGQPIDTLAQLARIIKPGGALALAVPNLASWQAQATRYAWFHLDLPRHRTHFTAAALRRQLTSCGFHVTQIRYFSAEQNIYGWIQSLLNRSGLEHNLLYDLLRTPAARRVVQPWRSHPWQALVSLLGLVGLLVPAFGLAVLEACFGAGGTVELLAVREAS